MKNSAKMPMYMVCIGNGLDAGEGESMGSDIKCQCARLERSSTGSWMTLTNSVVSPQGEGVLMKDGLTFSQWEFIVIKHFPGWELVSCSDNE